jgi:NADPH:quinone reductase-like Zn-dependent oxidoreductase
MPMRVVSLPTLGLDQLLVEVRAAAANPSDVKNNAGTMDETCFRARPDAIVRAPLSMARQSW